MMNDRNRWKKIVMLAGALFTALILAVTVVVIDGGSASFSLIPTAEAAGPGGGGGGNGGGGNGGGGSGGGSGGTTKGDLYGDMYILLRNPNGEPIIIEGNEQVVAFIDENVDGVLEPLLNLDGERVAIPYTVDGDLATTMLLDGVTYTVYPGEVEFGRLSVARSPTKVIAHALEEALAKLTSGGVVAVDATGRLTVDGVAIDSPLENIALYDEYMSHDNTIPALIAEGIDLPAGFAPEALLAAAADKTGTIIVDTVVYINSVLGINTGGNYYDFSDYDYDRAATWGNVEVWVLVQTSPTTYELQKVNVYQTVFNSENWNNSTDPTFENGEDLGGADDFAQKSDDFLQVIEFVHDNEAR